MRTPSTQEIELMAEPLVDTLDFIMLELEKRALSPRHCALATNSDMRMAAGSAQERMAAGSHKVSSVKEKQAQGNPTMIAKALKPLAEPAVEALTKWQRVRAAGMPLFHAGLGTAGGYGVGSVANNPEAQAWSEKINPYLGSFHRAAGKIPVSAYTIAGGGAGAAAVAPRFFAPKAIEAAGRAGSALRGVERAGHIGSVVLGAGGIPVGFAGERITGREEARERGREEGSKTQNEIVDNINRWKKEKRLAAGGIHIDAEGNIHEDPNWKPQPEAPAGDAAPKVPPAALGAPNWAKGMGVGLGALGAGALAHHLAGETVDEKTGKRSKNMPWLGPLVGAGALGLGAYGLAGNKLSDLGSGEFWKKSSYVPMIIVPHRVKLAIMPIGPSFVPDNIPPPPTTPAAPLKPEPLGPSAQATRAALGRAEAWKRGGRAYPRPAAPVAPPVAKPDVLKSEGTTYDDGEAPQIKSSAEPPVPPVPPVPPPTPPVVPPPSPAAGPSDDWAGAIRGLTSPKGKQLGSDVLGLAKEKYQKYQETAPPTPGAGAPEAGSWLRRFGGGLNAEPGAGATGAPAAQPAPATEPAVGGAAGAFGSVAPKAPPAPPPTSPAVGGAAGSFGSLVKQPPATPTVDGTIPPDQLTEMQKHVMRQRPEFNDPRILQYHGLKSVERGLVESGKQGPGMMDMAKKIWDSLGAKDEQGQPTGGISPQQIMLAGGLGLGAVGLMGTLSGSQTFGGTTGALMGLGGLAAAGYAGGAFDEKSPLRQMISGDYQKQQVNENMKNLPQVPIPLANPRGADVEMPGIGKGLNQRGDLGSITGPKMNAMLESAQPGTPEHAQLTHWLAGMDPKTQQYMVGAMSGQPQQAKLQEMLKTTIPAYQQAHQKRMEEASWKYDPSGAFAPKTGPGSAAAGGLAVGAAGGKVINTLEDMKNDPYMKPFTDPKTGQINAAGTEFLLNPNNDAEINKRIAMMGPEVRATIDKELAARDDWKAWAAGKSDRIKALRKNLKDIKFQGAPAQGTPGTQAFGATAGGGATPVNFNQPGAAAGAAAAAEIKRLDTEHSSNNPALANATDPRHQMTFQTRDLDITQEQDQLRKQTVTHSLPALTNPAADEAALAATSATLDPLAKLQASNHLNKYLSVNGRKLSAQDLAKLTQRSTALNDAGYDEAFTKGFTGSNGENIEQMLTGMDPSKAIQHIPASKLPELDAWLNKKIVQREQIAKNFQPAPDASKEDIAALKVYMEKNTKTLAELQRLKPMVNQWKDAAKWYRPEEMHERIRQLGEMHYLNPNAPYADRMEMEKRLNELRAHRDLWKDPSKAKMHQLGNYIPLMQQTEAEKRILKQKRMAEPSSSYGGGHIIG